MRGFYYRENCELASVKFHAFQNNISAGSNKLDIKTVHAYVC